MTVTLPPKLEAWVQEKVATGDYYVASEVVLDALWQLRAKEMTPDQRLDELRAEINIGLEQLDRGEVVDGEEAFAPLRSMSAAYRKRLAQQEGVEVIR